MSRGIINIFSEHKVAANLLMIIMLVSGIWSLTKLNIQFFPNFSIPAISVTVIWPGGSAEDVRRSVTTPIEVELKSLSNLKKLTSTSTQNSANIMLEFFDGTDMLDTISKVRDRVNQVRQLPSDIERPVILRVEMHEPIARVLVTAGDNVEELRKLSYEFERDLLNRGISKVDIEGLPDLELAIQVPSQNIRQIKQSLPSIANLVKERSQDISAGIMGKGQNGQPIRSENQRRSVKAFEELPLLTDEQGQYLRLGDVANITLRPKSDQSMIFFQGKPAVQLTLLREEDANALDMAEILQSWLADARQEYGESVSLHVYSEMWLLIKERIEVLLSNGASGLLLILAILFIFLNTRVAFWVAAGIPASFMAGIFVLYLIGESINMISLFALIMTIGIIVDDTIVIGEETLTNLQKKLDVKTAVQQASHKMLAPIMAASLTTISAFLPLLLITNIIGQIIKTIPIVVICVIIASVIECFLVLPGHLFHSMKKPLKTPSELRQKIQAYTEDFIEHRFRKFLTHAIRYRYATIASAISVFLFSIGLVIGGHVPFNFFPSPEGRLIFADAQFISGTNEKIIDNFVQHMLETLEETRDEFGQDQHGDIVETVVVYKNKATPLDPEMRKSGEQYASIAIELISPENRRIRNKTFMTQWRSRIQLPPRIDHFSISEPRTGPPGKDVDVRLKSENPENLRLAAIEIAEYLRHEAGVLNIVDETSTTHIETLFELTDKAKALGLTEAWIGSQIRAAFSGALVQIYHEPNHEIEVRVTLPDEEKDKTSIMEYLPILTPQGESIPINSLVNFKQKVAPDDYKHHNTQLTAHVTGEVDAAITTTGNVVESLSNNLLPKIRQTYNVTVDLEGKAEEQRETFSDMLSGLTIGTMLIYITLTWVFSSYVWPILVMSVIPLGLSGAIIGHLVMNIELTILSIFGLFGLSGIVVNDSIILMNEYRHLHERMDIMHAIVEAGCRRLRAVLLTSLTTIAGLAPLMFETSLQAQFLIPMAVSIGFGLLYATLLILVFVPAILSIYEGRKHHERIENGVI